MEPERKFRKAQTFVQWVSSERIKARVPHHEHLFFKKDDSQAYSQAYWATQYASAIEQQMPPEIEEVIFSNQQHAVRYAEILQNLGKLESLPYFEKIKNICCYGNVEYFLNFAKIIKKRICEFEDLIKTPDEYLRYQNAVGNILELEEKIIFKEAGGPEYKTQQAIVALSLYRFQEPKIPNICRPACVVFQPEQRDHIDKARYVPVIKRNKKVLLDFIKLLLRKNEEIPSDLTNVFRGDGENLQRLSEIMQKRLPLDLESSWEGNASGFVDYVRRFVRKPVSNDLAERVLLGHPQATVQYAFDVIRGFSSPQLTDKLHNSLVMSSFENPNSTQIKRYIVECENLND